MIDIVERLRNAPLYLDSELTQEAADEIERLRALVRDMVQAARDGTERVERLSKEVRW